MIIPFCNLRPIHEPLAADLHRAFLRVATRGVFLNGPEVEEFEEKWARRCEAKDCIACASGTDALSIIAEASGKMVFTVQANSCHFTRTGLQKAVGDRYRHVEAVDCNERGYPDFYGNWYSVEDVGSAEPVEVLLYGRLNPHIGCRIVDACQAHGPVQQAGTAAAYSFYPTKNLGAFGDGGAVTLMQGCGYDAAKVREIAAAFHSRLSELNAAILLTKLPHLDRWNAERLRLAEVYWNELPDWAEPVCRPGEPSNHHIFAVLVDRRDEVKAHLEAAGVGCKIHYEKPLADLPGAVRWTSRVLSLPLWVGMTPEQVRTVCDTMKGFR